MFQLTRAFGHAADRTFGAQRFLGGLPITILVKNSKKNCSMLK